MSRSGAAVAILAALAAGFVLTRANASEDDGEVPMGDIIGDGARLDDYFVDQIGEVDYMNASIEQRREGFLFMLRSCEHRQADVADGTCYQVFYGGAKFWDLSDHPVLTGEMVGVPLSPQMCRNAGFPSGVCVSTAAGAYQFTKGTWLDVRNRGGDPLPDFTPESQDAAALRLLARIGALAEIDAGNIETAIVLAGKRWASLPGAVGKQGQRGMDFAMAKFNEGTGVA